MAAQLSAPPRHLRLQPPNLRQDSFQKIMTALEAFKSLLPLKLDVLRRLRASLPRIFQTAPEYFDVAGELDHFDARPG